MKRLVSLVTLVLSAMAIGCGRKDARSGGPQGDAAKTIAGGPDTLMVFSLSGRKYTRVADPESLANEAREFLRRTVAHDAAVKGVVLDLTPGREGFEVVFAETRGPGAWIVRSNTFGERESFRLLETKPEIAFPPTSSIVPATVLRLPNGKVIGTDALDAEARRFLKRNNDPEKYEDKPRIFRLYFEPKAGHSVGYLEPDLMHGTYVQFSHDGVPVKCLKMEEPN